MANTQTVPAQTDGEMENIISIEVGTIFKTYEIMMKSIHDFGKYHNTLFIKGDSKKVGTNSTEILDRSVIQ